VHAGKGRKKKQNTSFLVTNEERGRVRIAAGAPDFPAAREPPGNRVCGLRVGPARLTSELRRGFSGDVVSPVFEREERYLRLFEDTKP
jgi:hypothetical protein